MGFTLSRIDTVNFLLKKKIEESTFLTLGFEKKAFGHVNNTRNNNRQSFFLIFDITISFIFINIYVNIFFIYIFSIYFKNILISLFKNNKYKYFFKKIIYIHI